MNVAFPEWALIMLICIIVVGFAASAAIIFVVFYRGRKNAFKATEERTANDSESGSIGSANNNSDIREYDSKFSTHVSPKNNQSI